MPSTVTGTATQPDARQQAPFEVGDFVDYSGTPIRGANGAPDYISAHTVEANVGVYTQPGTQPSYLAIGGFGVGTAAPSATGGITTQNAGPQPQRARLRATKAPNGLLSQPDRTVRVGVRSLCLPTPVDPTTTTVNQAALDMCFKNAATNANGLQPGQCVAPVFEFIFPENVKPGDLLVPNDLWHLPFLVNGEGAGNPCALTPAPW